MNRREFIAGAACAGGYSLAGGPVEPAKRILRVGMITDTHFGNNYESTERAGRAWRLFRELKADMVVHLGDICDHHYPAGFEGFRRRIEEIWPSTAPDHPREEFVWAWHDYFRYQGDPDRNTPKRWEAIAAARRLIKDPHELYDAFDLKGYSFVVVPQGVDFKRYEKLLSEAAAKHPGQPFFVCDHVPPQDTVYNSRIWGDRRRRDLFSKFPDCIVLTGHVHQSLRVESSIWQGAFTVANAGTLSSWDGNLVGTVPKSKACHHCLVMDVYPDVVEFRRYDVRTGEEVIGDARWRVPVPFDPKTAPYNPARRAETLGAAAFPADATLAVTAVFPAGATLAATAAEPFRGFALSFPSAVGAGDFEYRLEVAKRQTDGRWTPYVRQDIFSEFHLEPRERTGRLRHVFSAGYFTPGERVAFTVTPVSPYGKQGRPLRTEATVPATAGSDAELVWESKNPMDECAAYTGLKDGTRLTAGADGYFAHETRELRLVLPKTAWAGEKGTRFRFTVDLQMIQPGGGQWTVVLRNPEPMYNANARIATPKGDSGRQRYVIEFTQSDAAFWYYFLVREGTPGKIRFDYVKIEKVKD